MTRAWHICEEWILRFYYDININYDLSSHAWKGNSKTALTFLHATQVFGTRISCHTMGSRESKQLLLLMGWQLEDHNFIDKDRDGDGRMEDEVQCSYILIDKLFVVIGACCDMMRGNYNEVMWWALCWEIMNRCRSLRAFNNFGNQMKLFLCPI